jgi:hypothetical protein
MNASIAAYSRSMATINSTGAEKTGTYRIEHVATSNDHLICGYEPKTDEARMLDKRVNLKLDFIVVLVLAIDFILCGIDKTNIGYVATTSEQRLYVIDRVANLGPDMIKDANITQDDIADSVSILSVTFITLQPFSTAIGRRVGPKYWIAGMMVAWGTVCMAHAATKDRGTLIALRLLLGAFEAGFVPTSFVSDSHTMQLRSNCLTLEVLHVDHISQVFAGSPLGPVCRHVLNCWRIRRPYCVRDIPDQECFAA